MKELIILLYFWFKLAFGCVSGSNQINNFYSKVAYVCGKPVNETSDLESSLE